MKLKTLKDIFDGLMLDDYAQGSPNGEGFYEYIKQKLKAEAIKWLKELKLFHRHEIDCNEVSWIKHFFNLTEEDLK